MTQLAFPLGRAAPLIVGLIFVTSVVLPGCGGGEATLEEAAAEEASKFVETADLEEARVKVAKEWIYDASGLGLSSAVKQVLTSGGLSLVGENGSGIWLAVSTDGAELRVAFPPGAPAETAELLARTPEGQKTLERSIEYGLTPIRFERYRLVDRYAVLSFRTRSSAPEG